MPDRRALLWLLAAAVAALTLSSCRLTVTSDVVVDRDGSGTFTLDLHLDRELRDLLDELDVDPVAGLDATAAAAPGWTLEQDEDDGGGLRVRMRRPFARPDELTMLVEQLHAGLSDRDGSLLRDVALRLDDGATSFRADAGVTLPDSAGATGDGVAFTGQDMAALLADRGDELLRYDLRVSLPGPVTAHDADEVVDGRLVWHLPVGETVAVSAAAAAAPAVRLPWLIAGGGVAVAGPAALVGWGRGRRRQRPATMPAGWTTPSR